VIEVGLTTSERRIRIIQILNLRGQETMQNLADEFGVTARTIRNDINHLSLSYPLETIRGRYGGGVRVLKDSRTKQRYLKPEQLELLRRLSGCLSGSDLTIMNSIIKDFALN